VQAGCFLLGEAALQAIQLPGQQPQFLLQALMLLFELLQFRAFRFVHQ
jgi:hypothetical protein